MSVLDYFSPAAAAYTLYGKLTGGESASEGLGRLWDWGKGRPTAPAMGANPYQGSWDSLIGQLQSQVNSGATPMADNAMRQASNTAQSQSLSMARSGSAGGARQAGMSLANANGQIAGNYANAKLQEQLLARQSLMQGLQGAGNAWYQPAYANLLAQAGSPTNMQMLTGFLQQGFGSLAGMAH